MSKNAPKRPTRRRPLGSQIPDVILKKDPTKPPTQDNIRKVIEIKFPGDKLDRDQIKNYRKIAGSAPFELWTPEDCNCPKEEPDLIDVPLTVEDVAMILVLLAAIALVLGDDLLPGGQADDPALSPLITKLIERLAPILSKIKLSF